MGFDLDGEYSSRVGVDDLVLLAKIDNESIMKVRYSAAPGPASPLLYDMIYIYIYASLCQYCSLVGLDISVRCHRASPRLCLTPVLEP